MLPSAEGQMIEFSVEFGGRIKQGIWGIWDWMGVPKFLVIMDGYIYFKRKIWEI
jgi:hypothetical protein